MLRLALFSWVLVLLVTAPAAADVVMSPPTDCPPGAAGATCHSGTFCALVGSRVFLGAVAGRACAPDGTCSAGAVCRTYGVRTAAGTCAGGQRIDSGANIYPVTRVTGACAIGSMDCTTARVCEPIGPPPAGGCTASDGAGGSVVAVAVLAAAALLGGRRRARGSRASRRLERSEVPWSATSSE